MTGFGFRHRVEQVHGHCTQIEALETKDEIGVINLEPVKQWKPKESIKTVDVKILSFESLRQG